MCGNKFDVFWWGSDVHCRKCFEVARAIPPQASGKLVGDVKYAIPHGISSQPSGPARRSFDAANTLFDLLTIVSWAVVVFGVIAAVVIMARTGSPFSLLIGASGAIAGFILLASVQIGRAVVHTAETTDAVYRLLERHFDSHSRDKQTASEIEDTLDDLGI